MARSVTYYVRPGEGLVVQEAHPLADDETTFGLRGTPRVIDPDVIRVRFRYLMEKGQMDDAPQWIETWNAEGHLGDTAMTAAGEASALQGADPGGRSDALDELPLAVEVTIVREGASGGRTSNFLFPIHTGRRF
jgi:hypothetical protein